MPHLATAVRRDARRIARAINDTVTAKVLKRLFPGKPVLAQFAWDTEKKRTSREVLEDAGYAKTAGLAIDLDQVQELTGYKLEKAPEQPSPAPGFAMNSRPTPGTPLQTREKPLQNSPRVPDGQGDLPGENALTEALEAMFAKSLAEAAAGAVEGEAKNMIDANGMLHGEKGSDNGGQFVAKGEGGGGASGASADKPTEKKPDADDLDTRISKVPTERIAEIAAGETKGLVTVEEGIAVVLDNPTFKDKSGRDMKFDSSFAAKYRYGHGRSMNEADLERFRHVQNAIYAVTHDEHPVITFKGKKIVETTDLPRGSQRCYRTDTTNGETWAISWADKVYVRSIQERAKNNPPYKT